MNKILIAEPIYSAMPPSVYFNRIAFWKETFAEDERGFGPNHVRSMVIGPRNGIRIARDKAVRAALEHKATHLFFMDDDILVPPDILSNLLAVDQPIVGGLIHRDNGGSVAGSSKAWCLPVRGRCCRLYANPNGRAGQAIGGRTLDIQLRRYRPVDGCHLLSVGDLSRL
jgi:hypothetical protein